MVPKCSDHDELVFILPILEHMGAKIRISINENDTLNWTIFESDKFAVGILQLDFIVSACFGIV